ncbi:MAG: MBL fold metallo-hydrolase [Anaeroplasmataceae bacterium]
MKVTILKSGSKGNCSLLETNYYNLIIDAGISYKELSNHLLMNNLKNKVDYILLTHEHKDHISGLLTILTKYNSKVFLTEKLRDFIVKSSDKYNNFIENFILINENGEFNILDIKINSFQTSHDSITSVGFVIEKLGKKLVYITDTGYVDSSIFKLIENADIYVIEFNHDPSMLMNSNRFHGLKQRIIGDAGHLSNMDAAYVLAKNISRNTHTIFIAHISEECNRDKLISQSIKEMFNEYDINSSSIDFIFTSTNATKAVKL